MDIVIMLIAKVIIAQASESMSLKWHKKEIENLKHQVEYYKAMKYCRCDFMEYALEIHDD